MQQKQIQKIAQKLSLTQGMQQSIAILAKSTIELRELIESSVLENPFLEFEGSFDDSTDEKGDFTRHTTQQEIIERLTVKELTLKEHLISQIGIVFIDQKDRQIAYYLTDLIDENGYLFCDFSGIARMLNARLSQIEKVLKQLQTFDPIGVYASSLAESLEIQAKEKEWYNEKFSILLANLDLVAKLEFDKLLRICDVKEAVLKRMMRNLKSLNPKPGKNYFSHPVEMVIPEIIVASDVDGNCDLFYNDISLPRLSINDYGCQQSKKLSKEDREFIAAYKNSAKQILSFIKNRESMMLRVVKEIVRQQKDFFKHGVRYLRPMLIKDVAKNIGVHESTISRVSNKYIQTSYGIFRIKSFFSGSVKSAFTEGEYSTQVVKSKMQSMIKSEYDSPSLSDEKISYILKEKFDIVISRRAVAKYRQELGIPSLSMRKRLMRVSGCSK